MAETAADRILDALHRAGRKVRQRGNETDFSCPCVGCHSSGDTECSAGFTGNSKGNGVVVNCLIPGCSAEHVVSALGLTMSDLWDDGRQRRTVERRPEDWRTTARYQYVDAEGELICETIKEEKWVDGKRHKRFKQRQPIGEKWQWDLDGITPVPYRLPGLLAGVAAGEDIWIVEGEKDVETLVEAGLCATTTPMGAGNLAKCADALSAALTGAERVKVIIDDDHAGRIYGAALVELLAPIVGAIEVWRATRGNDITDHIANGGELSELEPVDTTAPLPPTEWVRPELPITNRDQKEFVDDLWSALNGWNDPACISVDRDGQPVIYERGGDLIRLKEGSGMQPTTELLTPEILRSISSDAVRFVQVGEKGDIKSCFLSMDKARAAMVKTTQCTAPPLKAITMVPVFRQDGTFRYQRGYDKMEHLFLCQDFPEVSATPSDEQLAEAVAVVDDLIGQFPFETSADRANAFGLLVSVILRPTLRGHMPLALINAHDAGTGKSLLATTVMELGNGFRTGNDTLTDDDAETEKRITAILDRGRPVITWDNITSTVNSPALTRLLTEDVWSGRILGTSKMVDLPMRSVVIATGNNISIGGDMARRVFVINMNTYGDDPETRVPVGGWRHDDLLEYALENRVKILSALVTMVSAWVSRGRPKGMLTKGATFDWWSRAVGGILDVAGIYGFLGNDKEFRSESDVEASELAAFYEAAYLVFGHKGIVSNQIGNLAGRDMLDSDEAHLLDMLPSWAQAHRKDPSRLTGVVGRKLALLSGQHKHGWSVVKTGEKIHNKVVFIFNPPSDTARRPADLTSSESDLF